MITSDLKQKMQDISEQYYNEISRDMEKNKPGVEFSRLNGEIGITLLSHILASDPFAIKIIVKKNGGGELAA